jgi:LysM repeat protein
MKPWRPFAWLALAVMVVNALAGCASEAAAPSPPPTPALLPYIAHASGVAQVAANITPQATPVIIASPTPTATPVTHVVRQGDTLLSVAIQHGVSLEALQAANPTVLARFLSIGTVLVIPSPEGPATVSATQLPPPLAPVKLSVPACFAALTGSLYCFVEAQNIGDVPVENVSARVVVAGSDGLPLAAAGAYSALDVILPGARAPLVATISPAPAAPIAAAAAYILTANLAIEPAQPGRVVALALSEAESFIGQATATVSGVVMAPDGVDLPAAWVVLTIYGRDGGILGLRKLAFAGGLAAGEMREFSITAASFGGDVHYYTLAAEGRP